MVRTRYVRSTHEHRDDSACPSRKGSLDFAANVIFGTVQATPSLAICHADPETANHHQDGVALIESLFEHFCEVDARLDRVDVHEHIVRTEARGEVLVEATRVGLSVLAPVADEDPWPLYHPAYLFLASAHSTPLRAL